MVTPWQSSLTLILRLIVVWVAGIQLGVNQPIPLTLGRILAEGDSILDVLQSTSSSLSSSYALQVYTLPEFKDQWRIITSNWIVLNIVKGHHFSLGATLHNFVISDGLT